MNKEIYISGLILLLLGCSGDDSGTTIVVDFIDNDGDGVENTFEEVDNTDPNDPCDYMSNNQVYYRTTEAWRNLDCDGDGVINGKEVDPDGNTIDDGNGTDPLDNCSFRIGDQSVAASNEWLSLDCDNDCKTNAEELADGTDPTDENDFVGSGDYIKEVISYDLDGIPYERHFFDQNGSRITEIKNGNDITLYAYVYENNHIKEIHTFSEEGYAVTDVIFEYTGNQITSFSVDFVGNLNEYTVMHEGVFVTAHHSGEPPGLFWRRLEFDASMEHIVKAEWYRNSNADYIYTVTDYTYDGAGNRTSYTAEVLGYDPDTGDYYPIMDYPITSQTYEYSESVLNPMYDAYKPLEVAGFLSQYGLNSPMPSPTSPNFCIYDLFDLGYDEFEYNYEVDCAQSNGKPIEVTYINNYGSRFLRQFIYE